MRLGQLLLFSVLFFSFPAAGKAIDDVGLSITVASYQEMKQEELRAKLSEGPSDSNRAALLITLILKEYDAGETELALARAAPFLNWLANSDNVTLIRQATELIRQAMQDRVAVDFPALVQQELLLRLAGKHNKYDRVQVNITTSLAEDYYRYNEFTFMHDLFIPALPIMKKWQPADAEEMIELAEAWQLYGQALVHKRRVSEAIEIFQHVETLYKLFPEGQERLYSVYIAMGEAFLSIEDYARAEELLVKGIEAFPSARTDYRGFALSLLASSQHRQGKLEQALATLESYSDYPEVPRLEYRYAFKNIYSDVLVDLKRYEDAKKLMEEAFDYAVKLESFDFAHDAMHKLGFLEGVTGSYAGGERLIMSSIKAHLQTKSYNLPGAYLSLSRLKNFHGEYKAALDAYREFKQADDILRHMHNMSMIAELDSVRSLQAMERERDLLVVEKEKMLLEQSLNEQSQQVAMRQAQLGIFFLLLAILAYAIGRRVRR